MKRAIFAISLVGLLFSGYLSGVKMFSDTCAFGESCPYFFGYPACYFGFILYFLLTLFSLLWNMGKLEPERSLKLLSAISFAGVLFAGYFTIGELPALFEFGFSAYFFGLPTCALGLIFFILIFCLAVFEHSKSRSTRV